jgi:hypothetical protein
MTVNFFPIFSLPIISAVALHKAGSFQITDRGSMQICIWLVNLIMIIIQCTCTSMDDQYSHTSTLGMAAHELPESAKKATQCQAPAIGRYSDLECDLGHCSFSLDNTFIENDP